MTLSDKSDGMCLRLCVSVCAGEFWEEDLRNKKEIYRELRTMAKIIIMDGR